MKRMFLLALALLIVIACSGCLGLQKADLVNATMVPVTNAQGEQGSAFSFSSTKFSKGIWQGNIIDGFASGSGSMVMYDAKGKQSGVFDGTLHEGKAIDMGTLQFGAFSDNGKLTKPIVVYTGLWQNGLPNGSGKMEVYGQDGRLAYFLTGAFKDGAVNGPYFQFNPKQGTWISGFNDSEHQKPFAIE
jgi:hypothetical protein